MTSRAVVLGGGGVTGVAWEIGILSGLAESGVGLATADLVVGTSAGSATAAQLCSGVDLETLYTRQIDGYSNELPAKLSLGLVARYARIMLLTKDQREAGVRFGKLALAAHTVPEADRLAVIASRLPVSDWPQCRLLITAVDAETGEFRVFDRDSGVPLVAAVAASCAVPGVWAPVTIDGRRYIDGGIRSAANADLAADHERIVVIAPEGRGGGSLTPLAAQVAQLRATSQVVVVTPDAAARRAAGRNSLDPSRRPAAARAGRAQSAAVAAAVAELWGS